MALTGSYDDHKALLDVCNVSLQALRSAIEVLVVW